MFTAPLGKTVFYFEANDYHDRNENRIDIHSGPFVIGKIRGSEAACFLPGDSYRPTVKGRP